MAQRPSFDMTRLSTADRILLAGGALFFIDTFLAWQRVCVSIGGFAGGCASANAWGGNAAFLGVLAALCALALVVWVVISIAGMTTNVTVPAATISAALAAGVLVFAVLKFLLIIGNALSYGGWIGLVLALVVAYGGYMKWREGQAGGGASYGEGPPPPPSTGGFTG